MDFTFQRCVSLSSNSPLLSRHFLAFCLEQRSMVKLAKRSSLHCCALQRDQTQPMLKDQIQCSCCKCSEVKRNEEIHSYAKNVREYRVFDWSVTDA